MHFNPQPIDSRLVDLGGHLVQQRRQKSTGFIESTAEQYALSVLQRQAEAEPIALRPAGWAELGHALGKIPARRGISGRGLCLASRAKVELCHSFPLGKVGDEGAAEVELVDHLEYSCVDCLVAQRRHKATANPQVGGGALLSRNEGVRGFLDSVVKKLVSVLLSQDKPGSNCFPQMRVCFVLGYPIDRCQYRDLCTVSHTGEPLQHSLACGGKPFQFLHHRSTTLSVKRLAWRCSTFHVHSARYLSKARNPSSHRAVKNWIAKNGLPAVFSCTSSARGSARAKSQCNASPTIC